MAAIKMILRIAVSIMLTYALLMLTACEPPRSKDGAAKVQEDFEQERREVTEDLKALLHGINERLNVIARQGRHISDNARAELKEANELLAERVHVEQSLEQVTRSTEETWLDVREGAPEYLQGCEKRSI